jgi:hypothetical protein
VGRSCTGQSQGIAEIASFLDLGKGESFDTKVSGLVAHLVVGQVGGLYELVAALVDLVLQRGEDVIARMLASPSSGARLLGIQVHKIELKAGNNC